MTTFQDFAASIIAAIPGAVAMPGENSSDWHCNFTIGNAVISLSHSSWKADKTACNVTGYLTRQLADHKPYGVAWPECKVSMTRQPGAIAADIQRKILAPLQSIIATAIERKAAADDAAAQLAACIARVAAISPDITIKPDGHFYAPGASGYISSNGAVYLSRLSYDDGEKIMRFLFDKPE